MKEMVGGCCVCSDDRGWAENPLVYCDGQGCTVAVHQACYGIVTVPIGNWYCRKCESQERSVKVRCELCPNKEGALKPTDNNAWAHVVCALYIPEVRFGNVTTMEPIILAQIPQERYNKTCYICEERSRSRANVGACMQCNKAGCRQQFHVTCAQGLGLLCEEASNYMENVKYCGYCHHHYTKLKKGGNVKVIPPYRPVGANDSPEGSPVKETEPTKTTSKRKLSAGSSKSGKTANTTGDAEIGVGGGDDDKAGAVGGLEGEGSKIGNKRRKGGSRTPPVGIPSPESSSRPSSPGSSTRLGTTAVPPPVATPPIPPQHAVSKESSRQSIVVTVPLDALPNNVASIATPSPPPTNTVVPAVVGSTSASSTLPSDQVPLPAKRQRSQSSEKSEKGRRWMKRNSSGKSHSPPPQSQQSSGSKSSSPGESSNSQLSSSEGKLRRSAPGSGVVVKEEKDVKIFQNGLNAPHMLGNQLNPSSVMAQKMCDTLSQEMVAHSVFTQQEPTQSNSLVGPQLHRPHHAQNRIGAWTGMPGTTNNHNTTNNNNIPQSLEQLLERQWEQGSQFLMEQAQHFDIASLLSCLHQLRAENAQLEEHVTNLVQRRDHLLAVNARLAIPLVQQQHPQQQQQQVNNVAASTPPVNNAPAAVENGMATAAEQVQYQRNTPQSLPRSNSAGFPGSGQQIQPQNSVVVRASSGDQRRSSSAGSNYSNHNNPGMYSSSGQQQPQSQQSQVVIRRDVISDLHHNMSSGGGKQSQP
ncbi:unnamed protein product [Nezara viridula]|uniref:Protein AF-10 n=1 Tax=Nezara viridula TaxID=85310 RepID=A0A9P0H522_NEZVI|nr:unnamed protein product [Nezara viridula]